MFVCSGFCFPSSLELFRMVHLLSILRYSFPILIGLRQPTRWVYHLVLWMGWSCFRVNSTIHSSANILELSLLFDDIPCCEWVLANDLGWWSCQWFIYSLDELSNEPLRSSFASWRSGLSATAPAPSNSTSSRKDTSLFLNSFSLGDLDFCRACFWSTMSN